MNDPKNHVCVATHTVKTQAWAKQSNMNMDRMWGIIKRIVEEVEEARDQEDSGMGEYILLKDFNKTEFRLYKKDDGEDEDEEEGEDEK